MRKKALSVMLVSAMVAGCLAGCGGGDSDSSSSKSDSSSSKGSSESSSSINPAEAPSTDGWDDSKKIYAYSWDEDFSKKLGVVLDAHPEYKDYVEFVTLGVSGTQGDEYKTAIDNALGDKDKYASLIPADNDVAKYWSEDDEKTMNLADLGFTDDVLSNSYDFAKQYGTFNGNLKALTWQATPGSIFYRRDIAKDVLGTDDPEKVQEALKDWDAFFETAGKMKDKGYKMVSGPSDIKYAIWDTQSGPWVTDDNGTEVLTLDNSVSEYLEAAKRIYDNGYSNNTKAWDGTWFADMKDDAKVFCFFGCPWFIGSMTDNGASNGSWGACVGPTSYHWGGTYVMVGKDTPNPELCAYLLYELTCDPDIGVQITNKFGDCVNNKAANERLSGGELSDDNAAKAFLGGQDPIGVWAEAATGLDLSNCTYQDATIKSYIDTASESYNAGEYKSVDDAIQYVKDQAKTQLGISAKE